VHLPVSHVLRKVNLFQDVKGAGSKLREALSLQTVFLSSCWRRAAGWGHTDFAAQIRTMLVKRISQSFSYFCSHSGALGFSRVSLTQKMCSRRVSSRLTANRYSAHATGLVPVEGRLLTVPVHTVRVLGLQRQLLHPIASLLLLAALLCGGS